MIIWIDVQFSQEWLELLLGCRGFNARFFFFFCFKKRVSKSQTNDEYGGIAVKLIESQRFRIFLVIKGSKITDVYS